MWRLTDRRSAVLVLACLLQFLSNGSRLSMLRDARLVNSMSENENLSDSVEAFEVLAVDLKATIGQYLLQLAQAGVETLPKGAHEFSFIPVPLQTTLPRSLDSRVSTIAPSAPGNSETHTQPIEPNRVSESGSEFVVDRPAGQFGVSLNNPAVLGTGRETVEVPIHSDTDTRSRSNHRPQSKQGIDDEQRYPPAIPLLRRRAELAVIQAEVAGCTRCTELAATRTQTVFGVGEIAPRLVFLGEGPGADEDRAGEPFVGAAGKLLDKIIAACKITRSDVYILNTVKCRPPGNRNPSQVELDHCWGYAERQLEILQPEFICCLGSVAAKRLLNSNVPLGQLRQKFHSYRGSRVVVTYHPAYLLRTESAKKHVWEDMKMLMQEMGVDLTK